MLIYRFAMWLAGIVYDIACLGEYTACAGGFYEMVREIGPFVFLYNTDGYDLMDTEIQLLGYVLFHSTHSMDWEDYAFPLIKIDGSWRSENVPL